MKPRQEGESSTVEIDSVMRMFTGMHPSPEECRHYAEWLVGLHHNFTRSLLKIKQHGWLEATG